MSVAAGSQTSVNNKRASFYSRLIGPSGLPSSPSPRSCATSECSSNSPRSPAAGWQSPAPASLHPQSPPGPPSPCYSMKTQSSAVTTSSKHGQQSAVRYVPMNYKSDYYAPVSSILGAESAVEKEKKGASRLRSMFSRMTGGKKRGKRRKREEEVEEVTAHNDYMDDEY
ncbi:hypothetical protein FKW77_002257 [Venturia effusa]|uniref:Uncharacterized protein n=1 Tax=Venturia effusa TaxID=50376 RepID=A0A517LI89_9PEZI|nr:hypothetical protein FKW77_002257 [Venturia effusa]